MIDFVTAFDSICSSPIFQIAFVACRHQNEPSMNLLKIHRNVRIQDLLDDQNVHVTGYQYDEIHVFHCLTKPPNLRDSSVNLMSVPRPAMFVAIVTDFGRPAFAMISASRAWFSHLILHEECVPYLIIVK